MRFTPQAPVPDVVHLFAELKRRKVFRVAAIYAIVAWVVVQVAETTFPLLGLPPWTATLVLALALAGLPLALVLAWAYDVTPEGVRADAGPGGVPAEQPDPPPRPAASIPHPSTGDTDAGARPGTRAPARSIAVLPFANLSAEPENEFFTDGVTEEILDALSKVTTLRVAARTASWAFKGRNPELEEVADKLRVATALQGSIRRSGNRVRISAQLVDLEGGHHLWSDRYDRELSDLLGVQEDIARSIVDALRLQLTERESDALAPMPATDMDAYEAYLVGRWHLHKLTARSLDVAIRTFRRALDLDPGFARAWAGLAEALILKYTWILRRPDLLEQAKAASRNALEHGPNLAESRTARGSVLSLTGQDEAAQEEFERAVQLDPQYFEAYFFSARSYFRMGRMKEAAERFARAHEVRPDDFQTLALQLLAVRAGELGGDEELARRALAAVHRHLELIPDDPRAFYLGAIVLIQLERTGEARDWLDRAMELDPEDPGVAYNVACGFAQLGETDRAIAALEKNIERGVSPPAVWVRNDPDFDPIRHDPRFDRILESLE